MTNSSAPRDATDPTVHEINDSVTVLTKFSGGRMDGSENEQTERNE